jgi:hypothetical protein
VNARGSLASKLHAPSLPRLSSRPDRWAGAESLRSAAAPAGKQERLRQAKAEAEKEIAAYRAEREGAYQKRIQEVRRPAERPENGACHVPQRAGPLPAFASPLVPLDPAAAEHARRQSAPRIAQANSPRAPQPPLKLLRRCPGAQGTTGSAATTTRLQAETDNNIRQVQSDVKAKKVQVGSAALLSRRPGPAAHPPGSGPRRQAQLLLRQLIAHHTLPRCASASCPPACQPSSPPRALRSPSHACIARAAGDRHAVGLRRHRQVCMRRLMRLMRTRHKARGPVDGVRGRGARAPALARWAWLLRWRSAWRRCCGHCSAQGQGGGGMFQGRGGGEWWGASGVCTGRCWAVISWADWSARRPWAISTLYH